MRKWLLSLFLLVSCSSIDIIDNNPKPNYSNFIYSSCSIHFCFYSDEKLNLDSIIATSESIFNYFIINYSFDVIDEYPYMFALTTSTKTLSSHDFIVYSSVTCSVSQKIIERIVNDIFSINKELYPWLYWGIVNHAYSRFCPEKESYYFNIIKNNLNKMSLSSILNYRPSKKISSQDKIYYANVYFLIRYLIDRYSFYKFSMFVKEVFKTGDVRNSSIAVFGEDIFLVYNSLGI